MTQCYAFIFVEIFNKIVIVSGEKRTTFQICEVVNYRSSDSGTIVCCRATSYYVANIHKILFIFIYIYNYKLHSLPNSSSSTRLLTVACFKISDVSFNSTKNVLCPAIMSSCAPKRVKIRSTSEIRQCSAGTCAPFKLNNKHKF